MRQTIARRLTQSVQEAPHFYTTAELDFTAAIAALPAGIGVNTLILYLTIRALQAQPELNATYETGHLYQYDHVHLAIAVALPDGLIAPVLHRADDYSLAGWADRSRDLIARPRASKLKPDELGGRHVHGQQSGHRQADRALHGHHQRAAGRHSGGRRGQTAPAGDRRRAAHSHDRAPDAFRRSSRHRTGWLPRALSGSVRSEIAGVQGDS